MALAAEDIRRQIRRILTSATFRNAGRLSRFLDYITTQVLDGDSADLKEYAIGVEVFQRGAGFDPRVDSVVRVEARRLRTKLRDYYDSEGVADTVRISIPKGSYVPVFDRCERPRKARRKPPVAWMAWSAGLVGVVVLTWFVAPVGSRAAVVAVLPLENLSSDPSNDFFCHGLADEAAARLQRLEHVRVITRGPGGPLQARSELGSAVRDQRAGYALEGSASFSPDRVHVTLALVELSHFTNVWQESYDRPAGNLLAVQSELASAVAGAARPFLR